MPQEHPFDVAPVGAVALVEVWHLTSAAVIADAMCKAAPVELLGLEINHLGAVLIKAAGETGAAESALRAGEGWAERLGVKVGATLIPRFASEAGWLVRNKSQSLGLLRSRAMYLPDREPEEMFPASLGMVETFGFVPAVAAMDEMLKAASVVALCVEKIGAAHVSMWVKGDVADTEASVETGRAVAESFESLKASYVIARPDPVLWRIFG